MGEITVYGIANCDTIKKARKWLDNEGIEYTFHDYRKLGLERRQLVSWVDVLGWESLLNRRGTTWRKLPDSIRDNIDENSAIEVMLDNPAIIKRPLLNIYNECYLGFNEAQYQALFH